MHFVLIHLHCSDNSEYRMFPFERIDNLRKQYKDEMERNKERIVHTSAYFATELASTAYTLLAPAWTAKKDNIPVPQPTSRTTYKNKKIMNRI